MSDMVKVRLLKPLDGQPEGATVEFDKNDVPTLEGMNAVSRDLTAPAPKAAKPAKTPAPKSA